MRANNHSFESSGGFTTHTGQSTNLASIAKGAGIERAFSITDLKKFEGILGESGQFWGNLGNFEGSLGES